MTKPVILHPSATLLDSDTTTIVMKLKKSRGDEQPKCLSRLTQDKDLSEHSLQELLRAWEKLCGGKTSAEDILFLADWDYNEHNVRLLLHYTILKANEMVKKQQKMEPVILKENHSLVGTNLMPLALALKKSRNQPLPEPLARIHKEQNLVDCSMNLLKDHWKYLTGTSSAEDILCLADCENTADNMCLLLHMAICRANDLVPSGKQEIIVLKPGHTLADSNLMPLAMKLKKEKQRPLLLARFTKDKDLKEYTFSELLDFWKDLTNNKSSAEEILLLGDREYNEENLQELLHHGILKANDQQPNELVESTVKQITEKPKSHDQQEPMPYDLDVSRTYDQHVPGVKEYDQQARRAIGQQEPRAPNQQLEQPFDTRINTTSKYNEKFPSAIELPKLGCDKLDDSHIIEISTMGQAFELGMLYDKRTDNLLESQTLWGAHDIKQATSSHNVVRNKGEWSTTGDSLQERSTTLGLETAQKLSILTGLTQVKGAAKYVEGNVVSKGHVRSVLTNKNTSMVRQVNMKYLAKNKTTEVSIENSGATHVVVGIMYGSQVVFILDLKENNIENAMQELQKCTNELSLGKQLGDLESVKFNVNDLNCTHFADFDLKFPIPLSFDDVVKLRKLLPSLSQLKENNVPLRAWLYPLQMLDANCTVNVKEISSCFLTQITHFFEEMHLVVSRCEELTESILCQKLPLVRKSIESFKNYVELYRGIMKDQLNSLIPEIREGKQDEQKLTQIVLNYKQGPFNKTNLLKWLKNNEVRSKIFSQCSQTLKDIETVVSTPELLKVTKHHQDVICFVLGFNTIQDQQLLQMEKYFESPEDELLGIALHDVTTGVTDKCLQTFMKYKKCNSGTINFIFFIEETNLDSSSIVVYKESQRLHCNFIPPTTLEKPFADKIDSDSAMIHWRRPISGAEFIKCYSIHYSSQTSDQPVIVNTGTAENSYKVSALLPNTSYAIKIQGVCDVGVTTESEASFIHTAEKRESLAERLVKQSKLIDNKTPNVYKLPLNLEFKDTEKKVRWFNLFPEKEFDGKPEKVLMIVGATGAGKSTLLNAIVNYLMGVKWTDKFRFKVVSPEDEESEHPDNQAFSQTEYITGYNFKHHEEFPVSFKVTVIDTPGYGDCRGIGRDQKITEQIRDFFSHQYGVLHVDAICFVTQSPGRLTATQRYIIDSILSIFARDIKENILLLITFADGHRPPVLDSVQEANIPHQAHYKFNNSALYADNAVAEDNPLNFDEKFWEMGMLSMDSFFQDVDKLSPKSLRLTQQVLNQRKELQATIQGLQPQLNQTISIALRPNPLSTKSYLEVLIKAERQQAKPGYLKRITHLEHAMEEAEIIEHIKEGKDIINYKDQGQMNYATKV